MSKPMDLIERLRKADPKSAQRAVGSSILGEAADEIERLRAALERIASHDPKTPGLHYNSIEQLLESAVGCARAELFTGEQTGDKSNG